MATIINYRILLRGGPASEWGAKDPVLLAREPALDTTTWGMKVGDGQSKWSELDYVWGGEDYNLTIGTVTTGTTAAASIGGVAPHQQLNVTLPRGEKGDRGATGLTGATGPAPTLAVGTVTTLAAGSPAAAAITSTGAPGNYAISFSVPKGDTGQTGQTGLQGVRGEKGDTGSTGQTGPANVLTIGTVTPGTTAGATITGTTPSQVLNLTLPQGERGPEGPQGPPVGLSIGTVTTGAAGSSAAAALTGTAPNQVLSLTIPRGATGTAATITGATATTLAPGSAATVTAGGTTSARSFTFGIPRGDVGPQGETGEAGPPNSLTIGPVTTGDAGTSAQATITGSAPSQTLNLTIPKGEQGEAAAIVGATAVALPYGQVPTVTMGGTDQDRTFQFGLPAGPQGIRGEVGPTGAGLQVAGTVDTAASLPTTGNTNGKAYVATDTGLLHVWGSSGWSEGLQFTGPAGATGQQGERGPIGDSGAPFRVLGTRATAGDLPTTGGATDPVASGSQSFTASTDIIANPERGFFQYTETHWTDAGGSGHTPLDATALAAARTGSTTLSTGTFPSRSLAFRYYVMEHMRTVDTIPAAFLNAVAADMAAAREAGVKLVIRFCYSTDPGTDYTTKPYNDDTTPARTIGHVNQLASTIGTHADVIHAVQAGFIGTWGEWFYTDNWGDLGTLTPADWTNRARLITALLSWDSRPYILLRYPGIKHRYLREGSGDGWTAPADSAARLGFHNDAFLASEDNTDWGTFNTFADGLTVDQLRTYLAQETARPVPMLGETAGVSGRSGYASAASELSAFHWSALNPNFHPDVVSSWTQAEKDEVSRRLGYRLRLTSATLPTTGGAGAAASVTLNITNDGYGAPLTARPLRLVFTGPTTVSRTVVADIRSLAPGTHTITQTVALPDTAGTYTLSLAMPDSSLPTRPEYAIRLANTTEWTEGRNVLGAQITVTGSALAPGVGYHVLDTGHLWAWDGFTWTDAGKITGPAGVAAEITAATASGLAAGAAPTVTLGGTSTSRTLAFGIPAGAKGDTGQTGQTGPANVLSIGTVSTLAAGATATASIGGTAPSQTLSLGIPRGATGQTGNTGPANVLSIGTVTTGAAGSSAGATITGTTPSQVLNLTIPVGVKGDTGASPTLAIGTVSTLDTGSPATASITGSSPSYSLNLSLPRGTTGANGPANTLAIGTVTTVAAGTGAGATLTGTAPNQTLNLTIPQGPQGLTGAPAAITGATAVGLTNGSVPTVTLGGSSSARTFAFALPVGAQGLPGQAATVSVGTVTTVAAGTAADVSNSGTGSAAILNFTIPQGPKGDTGQNGAPGAGATFSSVTATGLATGATPTATLGGTAPNYTLTLGIPAGPKGDQGTPGTNGQGVPTGGTAGQVLSKTSSTNYATAWTDPPTPPPAVNTPFAVRYIGSSWEYTTLAAAQAAGLNTSQTVWFIGNPGGSAPSWARTGDVWTQG